PRFSRPAAGNRYLQGHFGVRRSSPLWTFLWMLFWPSVASTASKTIQRKCQSGEDRRTPKRPSTGAPRRARRTKGAEPDLALERFAQDLFPFHFLLPGQRTADLLRGAAPHVLRFLPVRTEGILPEQTRSRAPGFIVQRADFLRLLLGQAKIGHHLGIRQRQ